jgi:hypothetical protein
MEEEKIISFTGIEFNISEFKTKRYTSPAPLTWHVINQELEYVDTYELVQNMSRWLEKNLSARYVITTTPVSQSGLTYRTKLLIICEDVNDALRLKLMGLTNIISDIKNNV